MARRLTSSECTALLDELARITPADQRPTLDDYRLLDDVLRTSYLLATDDELQSFASIAARQLYVHQALSVPKPLAASLEKLRIRLWTALRRQADNPNLHITSSAAVLHAWIRWHQDGTASPPPVLEYVDVDAAPSRCVRLIVTGQSLLHDSSGNPIPTFATTVDDTSQPTVLQLHGRWRPMGQLIRPGNILHVIDGRWSDQQTLLCGNDSFLVIEPDLLLDVTTVAECFTGRHNLHLLALWRLLSPDQTSVAAIVGTIVNACFDEFLADPHTDSSTAIERALRIRYLDVLAAIASHQLSLDTLQTDVQEHLRTIESVLPHFKGHTTTEPSFIAPLYGIQGRLDALIENGTSWRDVVELKSGSPPPRNQQLMASNGKSYTVGMRPNHAMQIAGYNLLLDAAFPDREGSSQILYSRASEDPLRNAPNADDLKADFLAMRNKIVAMYTALAQRRFRALDQLIELDTAAMPTLYQNAITEWKRAISSLSQQEFLYVQAYISFAFSEWVAQMTGNPWRNGGLMSLWRLSIPEKTEQLVALTYLRVNESDSDFPNGYIAFSFSDQTPRQTSFREGDVTVLYPHSALTSDSSIHGQVFKCTIRRLRNSEVIVSLRNKLFDRQIFTGDQFWALDADVLSIGIESMVRACADFVRLPQERRALLLGLRPPRTETRSVGRPPRLTDTQYAVYVKALQARDYFLLEGPPGTGKTSTMLRAIVEHLLQSDREVLLCTALTNRAADEICSALAHLADDGHLLRMGTLESTEHPDLAFAAAVRSHSFDQLQAMLDRARIIVATVPYLNANPVLFSLKRFTTAIIDEAAQLVEPQVVGIVSRVERFIMIGDACQLPAVVQQEERSCRVAHELLDAIELHRLDSSLFERLLRIAKRNGWHHAWGRLTEQARMHRIVAEFPSTRFYGIEFGTLLPWQRDDQALLPYDVLPEFLRYRLVFIESIPEPHTGYNLSEAQIVAACTRLLAQVVPSPLSSAIGIIAPFRKQIRTITELLDPALGEQITVDTVERFQGSERDHILLSCAVNAHTHRRRIESLVELDGRTVDRKLNVALTRARQQVIVVGCRTILEKSPVYRDLIAHIERQGIAVTCSEAHALINQSIQPLPSGVARAHHWH